jgi:CRP-like cAMP-binding protein
MQTQAVMYGDALRTVAAGRRSAPRIAANHVFADPSEADSLDQSMHLMGAVITYLRNTEIFGDNEPAEYLYKVVSGTVRTYKILSDGRRQIGGFYLSGDIFGLEFADGHTFSAEARCWWSNEACLTAWQTAMPESPSSSLRLRAGS